MRSTHPKPILSPIAFLATRKRIKLDHVTAESMLSASSDMPTTGAPASIRPATLDDLPALLAIEERAFLTDRMSPRSFRHMLTHGQADCLVAVDGRGIVGYAALFYRRTIPTSRLHSLAVDPSALGKGIGRQLLAIAERHAQRRGVTKLRLAVRTDNPAAIQLYRTAGYRDDGTFKNYYSDGMAALSMEKSLVGG